jgi:hypothetical protein
MSFKHKFMDAHQTEILSQAQLHEKMDNITECAGIVSYSDDTIVFFAPHGESPSWMRHLNKLGFVEIIYRTHPGVNGSIDTAQKLVQKFYAGQYAIYDIGVLRNYLETTLSMDF